MPETLDRRPSKALSTLPGAAVLLHVRRLLLWALGTAFVYSFLGMSARGGCPGGGTANGGFIDSHGQSTDVAPQCINLTLQPSPFIYAVIAIVVLLAITRVLHRSDSETAATRTLDRAVVVIVAIVGACIVITQVSFFMIPVAEWDGSGPFFIPFTFGTVDVDISPMTLG